MPLGDRQREAMGRRTRKAMADLEEALLELVASAVASYALDLPGAYRAAAQLRVDMNAAARSAMPEVSKAVAADMGEAFQASAKADGGGAEAMRRAATYSMQASRYTAAEMASLANGMASGAQADYYEALRRARTRVDQVGERAVEEAVEWLAERGVACSTYTRKDGTVVRVPVDVGVRRAMMSNRNGELMLRNTIEVASETSGLVAIGATANCRESHEVMQSRIFSLDPEDPEFPYFGDVEGLLDDFNCGHRFRVKAYHPGAGYKYTDAEGRPFPYGDPLDGTGYTLEEARDATTRQRELERQIRAKKRAIEVMDSQGLDTKKQRAQLRARQAQLRAHVAEHSAILRRIPTREDAGTKARTRAGAYGDAHLTSAQRVEITMEKLKAAGIPVRSRASVLGAGSGGAAKGKAVHIADYDASDNAQMREYLRRCEEYIRNDSVENAFVFTADGRIFYSSGDSKSVDVSGAPTDGATITHNHPPQYGIYTSFGSDDFEFLKENRGVAELRAVSRLYDCVIKPIRPEDIDHVSARREADQRVMDGVFDYDEDHQHIMCLIIEERGQIEYSRRPAPRENL